MEDPCTTLLAILPKGHRLLIPHESLQFVGQLLVLLQVLGKPGYGLVNVGIQQRHAAFDVIRRLPGEHLVQNHAECVDVRPGIATVPLCLLGADVSRRAHHNADAGQGGILGIRLGYPEVRQHGMTAVAEQDVLGLHVTVEDTAFVGIAERIRDRPQQYERLFGENRLAHPVLEAAAGEVLHGDKGPVIGDGNVVYGHDSWVTELRDRLAFPYETFGEPLLERQGRGHHLDGHLALQQAVTGEVHG